jgi:hypothetical protein
MSADLMDLVEEIKEEKSYVCGAAVPVSLPLQP